MNTIKITLLFLMVTTTILSSLAQTQSWDIGQLNLIKTDDLWHFETRDGQTVAELGIWSEVAGFHNYYMGTYSVSKLSDSYSDTLKLTNNMCHYFIVSNQEHEEFLLGGYQTIEPLKLARGIENIDEETQALFLYGDSIHKKIPEQTLPKLRFLSASNATLKAYSDQLPQIQQLRHLYISRGKGEEIPKGIGQLTNLMELRLSYMKINSLPPSIKNLTQLKVLSLFYNRFEELPKELEALQNLEVLVLTYNRLQNLAASIKKMQKLKYLYLNHNQLTTIPPSIGYLTSLEILDLSNNKLRSVPSQIGNLQHLKELHLSANQLKKLPKQWYLLEQLEILIAEQNQLKTLPMEYKTMQSLKGINFMSNDIPAPILHEFEAMFDLENEQLQYKY